MPAITKPNLHFDATLYTGTGSNGLAVTNGGFQPDLIWLKSRNNTYYHNLLDSVRGASVRLFSNLADAESNNGCQSSFDSNGFTLNADAGGVNNSTTTYVAWQWKGGGTAVTNNSGTLTSQVSANPTAGFSICTYTAPASSQVNTFGHGLGVAPSMVIAKNRSSGTGGLGWAVYHASLGVNQPISLNSSGATSTVSGYWGSGMTSSVVSLITAASSTGYDNCTGNMVAYCFAPIAGYSAFGSYTGNGSTNGPFVYLGFRPAFIITKRTNSADSWFMFDDARETFNPNDSYINANTSSAEDTNNNTIPIDFVSNGFKIRGTSTGINGSASTYIYAAFAENPFKFSNAK